MKVIPFIEIPADLFVLYCAMCVVVTTAKVYKFWYKKTFDPLFAFNSSFHFAKDTIWLEKDFFLYDFFEVMSILTILRTLWII